MSERTPFPRLARAARNTLLALTLAAPSIAEAATPLRNWMQETFKPANDAVGPLTVSSAPSEEEARYYCKEKPDNPKDNLSIAEVAEHAATLSGRLSDAMNLNRYEEKGWSAVTLKYGMIPAQKEITKRLKDLDARLKTFDSKVLKSPEKEDLEEIQEILEEYNELLAFAASVPRLTTTDVIEKKPKMRSDSEVSLLMDAFRSIEDEMPCDPAFIAHVTAQDTDHKVTGFNGERIEAYDSRQDREVAKLIEDHEENYNEVVALYNEAFAAITLLEGATLTAPQQASLAEAKNAFNGAGNNDSAAAWLAYAQVQLVTALVYANDGSYPSTAPAPTNTHFSDMRTAIHKLNTPGESANADEYTARLKAALTKLNIKDIITRYYNSIPLSYIKQVLPNDIKYYHVPLCINKYELPENINQNKCYDIIFYGDVTEVYPLRDIFINNI